ncbi:hypothetical protein BRADI_3g20145v3 [Brachypodium distachyon]|uniref:Uncharacterized protein n=1 Tax=Brachypodium distachyon TaxID=15368 RepID=A0A2K2CYF5_BRADI|nr:hypothetical protein BRADI_3g20145v3 [Brachypodium distachyon]
MEIATGINIKAKGITRPTLVPGCITSGSLKFKNIIVENPGLNKLTDKKNVSSTGQASRKETIDKKSKLLWNFLPSK